MPTPDDVVEHELLATERGGIHRVQVNAGVEHRFTIHDWDYAQVGPVEVLSVDGGANIFFTFATDEPATIDGRGCTVIPAAMGSVTRVALVGPTVVRLIADGSVLVSVQRARS